MKIIIDYWKPTLLFLGIITTVVFGILTSSLKLIIATSALMILGSVLCWMISMIFSFVFLMFKGISINSPNIRYGSILPWLKFIDTPKEKHWRIFIK